VGVEHFVATLALIGIVIVVSALLSGAVERSGLPQVAIFLLLGAGLGPAGLGLVDIGLDSPTLQTIATLGLVLVLFSDAITVDVGEIRAQRRLAIAILGPGTLLPALLIAVAAFQLLDVGPAGAAILGAALASTDPVLLRNLLRHRELPAQTKLALRLESGMNDVVLLPIVVLAMLAMRPDGATTSEIGRSIVGLFLLGPALGAAVGWLGITVLERVRHNVGVRRDYESLYALGLALTAFAAAEAVHGSGFLAAFAAGLVVALMDVELCDCFLDYGQATAEMFLLLTFVAFGASLIWLGIGVVDWRSLAFTLIALGVRTVVLFPVLAGAGVDRRNRALIAVAGPRGLSSLLLVLLPVFAGMPGAQHLFAITCLVVLVSVVTHGGGIALFLRREAQRARGGSGAPPPPVFEPKTSTAPLDVGADGAHGGHRSAERITLEELQELQRREEPVILADVRTERSFRPDPRMAAGAVRLPPDDAVRSARALGLSLRGTVVLYCA
jgi:NhaP-type Na+/H+ or K+/H+ antiporter